MPCDLFIPNFLLLCRAAAASSFSAAQGVPVESRKIRHGRLATVFEDDEVEEFDQLAGDRCCQCHTRKECYAESPTPNKIDATKDTMDIFESCCIFNYYNFFVDGGGNRTLSVKFSVLGRNTNNGILWKVAIAIVHSFTRSAQTFVITMR